MKLLQILYSGMGGHWSVVRPLLEADVKREFEHQLIFFGSEVLLPSYESFCTERGVKFDFIQKRKGIDRAAWKRVREILDEDVLKVVLFHSASLGLPLRTWKPKAGTRVFLVEHTSNVVKPWQEQIGTLSLAPKCERIVHLNETYYKEYPRYVQRSIGSENIRVIPNGIDLNKYVPGIPDEVFTVSMMGRFTQGKDFMTLLKACEKLVRQSYKIHLILAGDGAGWDELNKYVMEHSLQSWVSLPGLLSEDEVIETLQGCKLYVNSTLAETMSTISLQALSCGVPALITSIKGNQIFASSPGVRFFEQENEEDLSKKIIHIYEHEEERKEMAVNGRFWVLEKYSHLKMFEAYKALIEQ